MFIHLRLHTEFSVVDGTNRIDDAVAAAQADGQPALAITDLNNLFGAVKFYKAARGAGVKPVLGAEVSLQDFRKDIIIELYNEAGQLVIAYKVYRCWVSKFQALPDLDANGNCVAIESITLENEGWERDTAVTEPQEQ